MATSKEIRIENLRALVKEFKTADAVAQRAVTAPMYLSQILNSAKSSTGTARGVGDKLARKLEAGCGKPEGWMDTDHGATPEADSLGDRGNPMEIPSEVGDQSVGEFQTTSGSDRSVGAITTKIDAMTALGLISAREAMLLRKYRMASPDGKQKIEDMSDFAERDVLFIVHDQAKL